MFQGWWRIPLWPFAHFAGGLNQRVLVGVFGQSKKVTTMIMFCEAQVKYVSLFWRMVFKSHQPTTGFWIICSIMVLLRWFSWPMLLPTEVLRHSTLISMHWRWQNTIFVWIPITLISLAGAITLISGGTPRWDGNPWSSLWPILQREDLAQFYIHFWHIMIHLNVIY